MKKFLAFVLAMLMVLSLLPVMAFAEDAAAAEEEYDFAAVVAAAKDGDTVKLEQDVTATEPIVINVAPKGATENPDLFELKIDLNGHTYTYDPKADNADAAFVIKNKCQVHFYDSSLVLGKIEVTKTEATEEKEAEYKAPAIYVEEGNVAIGSGTYLGKLVVKQYESEDQQQAFLLIAGGTFVEDYDDYCVEGYTCLPYDAQPGMYGIIDMNKEMKLVVAECSIVAPNDYVPATYDKNGKETTAEQFPLCSVVKNAKGEELGIAVYTDAEQKVCEKPETDKECCCGVKNCEGGKAIYEYVDAEGVTVQTHSTTWTEKTDDAKVVHYCTPVYPAESVSYLQSAKAEAAEIMTRANNKALADNSSMEDYALSCAAAQIAVHSAKCQDNAIECIVEIDDCVAKIKAANNGKAPVSVTLKAQAVRKELQLYPELYTARIIKAQAIQEMQEAALTENTAVSAAALGLNFLVGIFGIRLDQSENVNLFGQILSLSTGLFSFLKVLFS